MTSKLSKTSSAMQGQKTEEGEREQSVALLELTYFLAKRGKFPIGEQSLSRRGCFPVREPRQPGGLQDAVPSRFRPAVGVSALGRQRTGEEALLALRLWGGVGESVPCLCPTRQLLHTGEESALSDEGLISKFYCYQRQNFRLLPFNF